MDKNIELCLMPEKRIVGFNLFHESPLRSSDFLRELSSQLADVSIDNSLLKIEGKQYLFVQEDDSGVVLRLLKNMGAVIASEIN